MNCVQTILRIHSSQIKIKRKRLIQTTVPTLFDVLNPPKKITPSWQVKTRLARNIRRDTKSPEKCDIPSTSQHTEEHGTPKKRNLERKVQALRTKLWRKSQLMALQLKPRCNELIAQLKHFLPIQTVNFIERQIMLHGSKSGQCRYAIKDKMMALSIFYNSRKAYSLLSKLFALPSKRTLQEELEKCKCNAWFQ